MDFRREDGPRGPRYLVNGKSMFSAYAPDREALTWAQALSPAEHSTLFLAGDVQGHLAQALSLVAPSCRVVHLLPDAASLEHHADRAWCWAPGGPSLQDFIETVLDKTGPADCSWQVWPAFERAAPDETLQWGRTFRDVYRTVQGSWLTWKHSAKTWWRNSLRNAVGWERPLRLVPGTRPLVVAASGPSLEEGWDVLRKCRSRMDLWALPSSFHALRLRGLLPDVGISTDGGFYAREHLQRLAGSGVALLSALSGAADPLLEASPTLFFGQGLPLERRLLSRFPSGALEIASQGTVAVTALQLALAATTGPVFVAGLDLAFRDFRGHASGHTVERRLSERVTRTTPWEGLWGERCFDQASIDLGEGTRTSPAMRTYALWLGAAQRFARPIGRISPSKLQWEGMPSLSWEELPSRLELAKGSQKTRLDVVSGSWPNRSARAALVRAVLDELKADVTQGRLSAAELHALLRSSVPEVAQEQLRRSKNPVGAPELDVKTPLLEFLATLEVPQ